MEREETAAQSTADFRQKLAPSLTAWQTIALHSGKTVVSPLGDRFSGEKRLQCWVAQSIVSFNHWLSSITDQYLVKVLNAG